jgi:glucosamine--fructose-6-phosphate aminotransferase (isomerizing)
MSKPVMDIATTLMRKEIHEIPQAVYSMLADGRASIQSIAKNLRSIDPKFVATVARGSSDHAATYVKYACELTLGLPVASIGPSVASIFSAPLKLADSASIIVSQSGKSPDIVKMAQAATDQGSLSIAITNETSSPLAAACNHTIHINAGLEASVAATKTFVTSALAGLAIVAYWKQDDALIAALDTLPGHLEQAVQYDWPELRSALENRDSLYVLGRGPSLAIANEAALKFKETCQLHAESYSSAEVLHGPVSIVEPNYPVLAMVSQDAAEDSINAVADQLARQGASVFATSDKVNHANSLPVARTDHPLTDPLALVVSFYAFVEKLALQRGGNPDQPPNLNKITETV